MPRYVPENRPGERLLTVDEYAELPDDGWRTELVRGRVVRELQPVQEKVAEYFSAGARVVWVIYPTRRTVAAHGSPREARFFAEEDILDGGELLAGLRVPVAELFCSC